MAAPWKWQQYGQCGKWLSDCVAPLGACVDDMAFVHNMVAKSNVHGPATFMQATGFRAARLSQHGRVDQLRPGQPERRSADVRRAARSARLCPQRPQELGGRLSACGASRHDDSPQCEEPDRRPVSARRQFRQARKRRRGAGRAGQAQPQHEAQSRGDDRLDARIRSYELAARMQLTAPEVLDLSQEASAYPEDVRPRSIDIDVKNEINETARDRVLRPQLPGRAAAAGARACVSCRSGRAPTTAFPAATGIRTRTSTAITGRLGAAWRGRRGADSGPQAARPARRHDHPVDDRVRPHAVQARGKGRDHNPFVFTNWLAAAASRAARPTARATSGRTSRRPDKPTYCYDIHATILHLLGIDHTKLTFRHNGIDRRLTDVHGHVIKDLLA